MKRFCLAVAVVLCSLFCSYADEEDGVSLLFNSWLAYDEALEKVESCSDGELFAAQKNLKSAKEEFVKNLYIEKESQFFKIQDIFYGLQSEFDGLIEAVQNDNRSVVAKKISRYMFLSNRMLRSSGKTYAVLLVLLSLMMAVIIAFIIFYQKTFARAQESEAVLESTMNAQENERRRLSQELHDSVAQEMRYVSMLADSVPQNSAQRQIANEIKERQKKCIEDIRAICYNLSPIDIERKNLGGALAFLCQDFMDKSKIATKLTIADGVEFGGFSKEQMHNIFRIVQELLSNIQKHAAATEVTVLVRAATEHDGSKKGVCVFVSDDGNGVFNPSKKEALAPSGQDKKHFGIRGINARLKALGATIGYKNIEHQGTDVKIYIPLTGGGARKWIFC